MEALQHCAPSTQPPLIWSPTGCPFTCEDYLLGVPIIKGNFHGDVLLSLHDHLGTPILLIFVVVIVRGGNSRVANVDHLPSVALCVRGFGHEAGDDITSLDGQSLHNVAFLLNGWAATAAHLHIWWSRCGGASAAWG